MSAYDELWRHRAAREAAEWARQDRKAADDALRRELAERLEPRLVAAVQAVGQRAKLVLEAERAAALLRQTDEATRLSVMLLCEALLRLLDAAGDPGHA